MVFYFLFLHILFIRLTKLLIQKFTCIVDLLLGVSRRITAAMDLRLLGAELGMQYFVVNSILHDYRDKINEAAYQLLSQWRREGIKQRKNGIEMEKTLLAALCSKDVGMNVVAAELKHDLERIRDTK